MSALIPVRSGLQPHQQRVVAEQWELDERRNKLDVFMTTETFQGLPVAERIRLQRQYNHMTDYSLVLGERIAAWES